MAYRQYIGARYVPLYEGTWDATRNYEPLSIVDDANGNSYTSRKDVPAGTPLNNRDYWVQTSSFSGAIDVLRRDVDGLQSDLSDLTERTDELETRENNVDIAIAGLDRRLKIEENRKFVFIGDSYAVGYSEQGDTVPYPERIRQKLGLVNGENYFLACQGGAGFKATPTFISLLNGLIDTMPTSVDKRTITDVFVCGGWNDVWQTVDDTLTAAVNSFTTAAKTAFPNCTVHVGMISYCANPDLTFRYKGALLNSVYYYYAKASNVAIIKDVGSALSAHPESLEIGGQFLHPSNAGQEIIADCIISHINGGDVYYAQAYSANVPTVAYPTGVRASSGTPSSVYEVKQNGMYSMFITEPDFWFETALSSANNVKLLELNNCIGHGIDFPYTSIPFSGTVWDADGLSTRYPAYGILTLRGNDIYLTNCRAITASGYVPVTNYKRLQIPFLRFDFPMGLV